MVITPDIGLKRRVYTTESIFYHHSSLDAPTALYREVKRAISVYYTVEYDADISRHMSQSPIRQVYRLFLELICLCRVTSISISRVGQ